MVALIPARAGSKRVPRKAVRELGGIPLIEWTIRAAHESGVFCDVAVCTDDEAVMRIAIAANAFLVTRDEVADEQADIRWVREALRAYTAKQFAILRPTSPFRTAEHIRAAYEKFKRTPDVHSLRAVRLATEHPGKMWWCNGAGYPLTPVCDAKRSDGTPWHSSPTQTLPTAYIQTAGLEMAWSYVVTNLGTISGTKILPFVLDGPAALDINTEEDWTRAERLVTEGAVALPPLPVAAQTSSTPS